MQNTLLRKSHSQNTSPSLSFRHYDLLHHEVGDEGASHAIQLFCSPASPGWVNTSYRQYVIKSEDLKIPPSGRKYRDGQIKSLRYPSFLTNLASKS